MTSSLIQAVRDITYDTTQFGLAKPGVMTYRDKLITKHAEALARPSTCPYLITRIEQKIRQALPFHLRSA